MLSEDMQQYLGVFLDEAAEQIELLEQSILSLEQTCSSELLQEIFRAAHTLKGSSRAMGYTGMGELTHAMEDIFDKLRKNEIQVSPVIINALFESLDMLKAMKDEISSTGQQLQEPDAIVKELLSILEHNDNIEDRHDEPSSKSDGQLFVHTPLNESQYTAMQEALSSAFSIFHIKVQLASDCIMKSVRALMVLQLLETTGAILNTTPGDEALENEQFDFSFGITYATDKSVDEIEKAILSISEISGVQISPYSQPESSQIEQTKSTWVSEETAVAPQAHQHTDYKETPGVEEQTPAKKSAPNQSQTIRVDVTRLDNLLNLVGELVIDQTRISQLSSCLAKHEISEQDIENLQEATAHFGRITGEMQEQIMKARMLPIDHVFNRFPRMMRDLAQKLNKDVDFVLWGKETELDRSVIEVIGDPLIHMLRNSMDHGIESPEVREAAGKPRKGTIRLGARHEENYIVIEVEDDGQGIDTAKLRASAINKGLISQETAARMTEKEVTNLIFLSGLSTAETVSDVSGRGVGMDIVKNNLTRFGALLEVESHPGKGCLFTIKLPLTLAIIRGLLVKVACGVYVIPLASVIETMRVERQQIHTLSHHDVILQRGMTLPLLRLESLFYGEEGCEKRNERLQYVVVVGVAEKRVGLMVDALLGEQEIVIKSLGKFIGDIHGVSGATILGDGHIALIADINGLIAIANEKQGEINASRTQNHSY
jgi:two-component system chemotaxis sensor kinase CheA